MQGGWVLGLAQMHVQVQVPTQMHAGGGWVPGLAQMQVEMLAGGGVQGLAPTQMHAGGGWVPGLAQIPMHAGGCGVQGLPQRQMHAACGGVQGLVQLSGPGQQCLAGWGGFAGQGLGPLAGPGFAAQGLAEKRDCPEKREGLGGGCWADPLEGRAPKARTSEAREPLQRDSALEASGAGPPPSAATLLPTARSWARGAARTPAGLARAPQGLPRGGRAARGSVWRPR